jgi:hypothetical protein
MKLVIILDEALEDVEKGRIFYDKQAAGLGDYFAGSILEDVASLVNLHGYHSRRNGYHWMLGTKFPYGIYYTASENGIEVHAILDQRARPSTIQRKLKKRSM